MAADEAADRRRVVIDEAGAARLDAFLAARFPDLSRNRIAQLLADGQVLVNDVVPRKSYRPAPGDVILVNVPPPEPSTVAAEDLPLAIVYEDDDLLVVDKAAGLVVHPAPGHRSGTLVNALLHHASGLSGIGGVMRPGIVHRLDRDTSGLMIVAKHDASHRKLAAALKQRRIRRIYLAAAWGHLATDELTVDAPIGRARSDRKRMAVMDDGRPARTHFRRLARWRAADLLEARLETGRTHQIRVHLAHTGHPVVGDGTYGAGGAKGISGRDRGWAAQLAKRVPRQFLHAAELRFEHPRTGEMLRFRSPLPPDLAAAAEWADTTSPSH
ncbi:MAG TPA: RluA family pseudouridine synthase [Longimicrobiales bacterium]|nr:RluA family pseudouridine synthase [Longimicrobiales bacterium]